MIDVATAGQLLDFGAQMGQGPRAQEQLEGAVAIHNILEKYDVAYLADEVGMGKTYVALGAMALFRHFNPGFRVAVIAPRENIQRKWMKELRNFTRSNVRFTDFRNRSIDGHPARPLVSCDRLVDFVHEAAVEPNRDFFLRLSSFSLGLSDSGDRKSWTNVRDDLLRTIPWLSRSDLSVRGSKEEFKDNLARAACCALPAFDLVIVDEAHNLKHGFGPQVAARNRVLALTLGHPESDGKAHGFPDRTPRAKKVLLLSATPIEEDYRQLWNQLHVFGKGERFEKLCRSDIDEDEKKAVVGRFLVRRVTTIKVAGEEHTKNQYRREWRRGGVDVHDKPATVRDARQRLIVALVQKKVAELLGSEKFNMSFQIGMLASFESFLETTRLKREVEAEQDGEMAANFDDPTQTDSLLEREGIDVRDINRLARHYRERFDEEMPHPKMDTLVEALADSWKSGRKSLVFVRRVASVKELKQKLDACYDDWLIPLLETRLPEPTLKRFRQAVEQYRTEKGSDVLYASKTNGGGPKADQGQDDRGGTDTFFAWFFRGEGPRGIVSGANIQRRFLQLGSVYGTFFEHNFIADLLGVTPGEVTASLARHLRLTVDALRLQLRERCAGYLSRARKHPRGNRVEAAQGAALELLIESGKSLAEQARVVWHARFETSKRKDCAREAPEVTEELEVATFFTEISRPEWRELRKSIWLEVQDTNDPKLFRQAQLRSQLLSSAARLGHAFIDLYILTIRGLQSLDLRSSREREEDDAQDVRSITEYLTLLDQQRQTPLSDRDWGAWDELHEIGSHFELIRDVNALDAPDTPLVETARLFGSQLRQQQPVAGMSGQINRTVIQQFRMPGYPFVLVSTDLLQEGEDLHTFCSDVYHYGISWTPSTMEQRIGRIDRVRSETDRRLNGREACLDGPEKLQVFYPYLSDTVEILQVNRVLERMNTFLRLMHEGLSAPKAGLKAIDVAKEMIEAASPVEAITTRLRTAFPIPGWSLPDNSPQLAVAANAEQAALARFGTLKDPLAAGLPLTWEPRQEGGRLLGTIRLANGRNQPFTLLLKSDGSRLVVRCISPVGRVDAKNQIDDVMDASEDLPGRIGIIRTEAPDEYDLTVEDDVLLAEPTCDVSRVSLLINRVVVTADTVEHHHFGDEVDHPMSAFEARLRKEGVNEGA